MKKHLMCILLSIFVLSFGKMAFGSTYKIGDLLCGQEANVCLNPHWAWGMVIYVDPKPSASGYRGIAMMLEDRTDNVAWALDSYIQENLIGANHYNIYGGKANQKTYCRYANSDCKASFSPPDTSAFNACTTYRGGHFKDWYLPSLFEAMLMFNVAQQMTYGADAKRPYECPSPYTDCAPHFFVNLQQQDYWSSTEAYGFGANAPAPGANQALFLDLVGGFASGGNAKNTIPSAVRCVRAIQ